MDISPQQSILTLGRTFYDPVEAADFPATFLRFRNDRAAASVGLEGLSDAEWTGHFGRFQPIPGSLPQPLALRYHGHQFRHYNPDLGDGRGFLFAQLRDDRGRLLDLGTKGSGQTPWSRRGDGRLTLKGGVREILATEMLEALGVNTSKTFSLIETGEALHRGDEPSPTRSAVMVRLSHSHIRIGTFQRLAYHQETEAITALVDYVLRNLYAVEPGAEPALQLLDLVVASTAKLAGQYMAAGFVHGVLNTDNINVTGESFDYGPWRFTPNWDPLFTAAYFDENRLYSFGRQPDSIYWNATQLAVTLRPLAESEPMIAILETFPERCEASMVDAMLWRLGVRPRGDEHDKALVRAIQDALQETGASIDRFFLDFFAGVIPPDREGFDEVCHCIARYVPRKTRGHGYWGDAAPCSMLIEEVEAIWAPIAESDDWSALYAKVAAIRRMGEALS